MSSLLTDKAEPSEALSATVAWSYGFDQPNYVLSSVQLDAFRHTGVIETEREMHGRRGAISSTIASHCKQASNGRGALSPT